MKHDENYRRLFTHRAMMQALLRYHIDDALTQGLLFEQATLEPAVHIRPDTARRESDVIWRIPHESGEEVYIVVLLEFQSSPRGEQPMALRMLQYATLYWEQALKNNGGARLPPILPIVLYNGAGTWSDPTNLHELLFTTVGGLYQEYCPQVRYILLDISAMKVRLLASKTDPASLLMRFEKASNLEEFAALIKLVSRHLSTEENEELRQVGLSMKVWLAHLAQFRDYISEESVSKIIYAEEVHMGMTLLEASMERWKKEQAEEGREEGRKKGREEGRKEGRKKGLEEGRKEGLEEGLEQGVLKGQRELLAMQLELRFGANETRDERLAQLDAEGLKVAIARILTASTEEDVFEVR